MNLPSGAVDSEKTLLEWQRDVLLSELEALTKLILIYFSTSLDDDFTHKVIPSQTWEEIGVSHMSFYRHYEKAHASGYLEILGQHEYESGGKMFDGHTICLRNAW